MTMEAEASNQVISMTLEGVKISIMLGGKAAAFGLAVFKSYYENRIAQKAITPGEQRLEHMMRSGKELNQFLIPSDRYGDFSENARKRGITFSATHFPDEEVCCVTIYQQDAARINRLIEDIGISDIDNVEITTEHEPVVQGNDSSEQNEAESNKPTDKNDYDFTDFQNASSTGEQDDLDFKMDDNDIDELYRDISPIESEGAIPFAKAAKGQEVPSESFSPHFPAVVGSNPERSELPEENDYTEASWNHESKGKAEQFLQESISVNNPSDRPSVKKRMNEIIESQLADKAGKSVEKKALEAEKAVKRIAENLVQ